jgi:hypothetical protein
MDTKIQKLGSIDSAKIFYDPLRKENSFLVLKKGQFKIGFINEVGTEENKKFEIILESGFNIKWEEISGLMGGFSSFDLYQKIKDKINEQTK